MLDNATLILSAVLWVTVTAVLLLYLLRGRKEQ
jgi:hypothetical protein